jgi:hypothetical protein
MGLFFRDRMLVCGVIFGAIVCWFVGDRLHGWFLWDGFYGDGFMGTVFARY